MNHLSRKTLFIILSVMSAVILVLTGLVIGLSLGRAGKDADAAQPPTEKEALAETSGTLSAEPEQTLPESTEESESGLKEKALMEVPTLPLPPETEMNGGEETEKEADRETEPAATQKQKEDRPETAPAATEEHPGGTENKESLPEETRPEETAPKETKEKKTEPAETEPKETKAAETEPQETQAVSEEASDTPEESEMPTEPDTQEASVSEEPGSEEENTEGNHETEPVDSSPEPESEPSIDDPAEDTETTGPETEQDDEPATEQSGETETEQNIDDQYVKTTATIYDVMKGGYYCKNTDGKYYKVRVMIISNTYPDEKNNWQMTWVTYAEFYANGSFHGSQVVYTEDLSDICEVDELYIKK